MKRILIIKFLAILAITIFFAWLIRLAFDPSFCYGNETLHEKTEFYHKEPEIYNTIMIGSSCFRWNLKTDQFDSLMPPEWKVYSYNFGSAGTHPPETYDFLEKLLKRHKGSIQNVIIELRDISLFPDQNRHTVRVRYFLTPKWYSFIVRAKLQKSSIPVEERISSIQQYGIAFMERWLNAGYINDIYGKSRESKMKSENRKQYFQTTDVRGYAPLWPQQEAERTRIFQADTSFLTKIAIEHRIIRNREADLIPNRVHLKKLLKIIETCNKAGIHCVFLFHPKLEMLHLEETIALAGLVPENHLIDISDPDLYPELYLAANSMNKNHFNRQGTRIFTDLVARNFQAIHAEWLENRLKPATTGKKHP